MVLKKFKEELERIKEQKEIITIRDRENEYHGIIVAVHEDFIDFEGIESRSPLAGFVSDIKRWGILISNCTIEYLNDKEKKQIKIWSEVAKGKR